MATLNGWPRVKARLALLACCCSMWGCGADRFPASGDASRIVGVKVYTHEGELDALFAQWKGLGVTTVFASRELMAREGFTALASRHGIDTFVIFPVFYAPEALGEAPGLYAVSSSGQPAQEDWVEFACPSRPELRQRRVEEAVRLVGQLRPDGLSIDFIRHFVFWEMVGPDRLPEPFPISWDRHPN